MNNLHVGIYSTIILILEDDISYVSDQLLAKNNLTQMCVNWNLTSCNNRGVSFPDQQLTGMVQQDNNFSSNKIAHQQAAVCWPLQPSSNQLRAA